MDQIEPVKLDMNFLNTAILMRQHEAGQQEALRHHAAIEQQAATTTGLAQQRVALDAAENVLKDPDATPWAQYVATNQRLKAMAGTEGLPHEDIPPTDFTDNAPAWKIFATKLDTASST